jgi:hypothetical protein
VLLGLHFLVAVNFLNLLQIVNVMPLLPLPPLHNPRRFLLSRSKAIAAGSEPAQPCNKGDTPPPRKAAQFGNS